MLAHNGTDRVGGLVGVVEGDAADVVVEDVGLDDAVEEVAADEAHLAVDGCCGAADKVPLFGSVVGERWVGVLEEGDGDCSLLVSCAKTCWTRLGGKEPCQRRDRLPSQWFTQR